MRPQDTRVWRRNGRKSRRGVPTGRRATHPVETSYGRHQKAAKRAAEHSALCAARRELAAATKEGNPSA